MCTLSSDNLPAHSIGGFSVTFLVDVFVDIL